MKPWLRRHAIPLLIIAVCIPAILGAIFWSAIKGDWFGLLAFYVIAMTSGIVLIWGPPRSRAFWTRLDRRQRLILGAVTVAVIWLLLGIFGDGWTEANWLTFAILFFWGAYKLVSRTVDAIWFRIRRR